MTGAVVVASAVGAPVGADVGAQVIPQHVDRQLFAIAAPYPLCCGQHPLKP